MIVHVLMDAQYIKSQIVYFSTGTLTLLDICSIISWIFTEMLKNIWGNNPYYTTTRVI